MSLRHLWLAGVSLALAVAAGLALGLAVARGRWAEPVTRAVGLLQTIPGIALLAFMLPVLGIGAVPAVVALFLYSLYPIVRAAVTGLGEADRGAVEAARALGMTAGADPAARPRAAGGAGDHGRHPHRGGDQRRHRDAGGAGRRRRTGRSDRRRAGAGRFADDPVGRDPGGGPGAASSISRSDWPSAR